MLFARWARRWEPTSSNGAARKEKAGLSGRRVGSRRTRVGFPRPFPRRTGSRGAIIRLSLTLDGYSRLHCTVYFGSSDTTQELRKCINWRKCSPSTKFPLSFHQSEHIEAAREGKS